MNLYADKVEKIKKILGMNEVNMYRLNRIKEEEAKFKFILFSASILTDISISDIKSGTQAKYYNVRKVCYYVMNQAGLKDRTIAKLFEFKQHTHVYNAIKKLKDQVEKKRTNDRTKLIQGLELSLDLLLNHICKTN
jgi:chromosomal replication initiation ATPase DnaA